MPNFIKNRVSRSVSLRSVAVDGAEASVKQAVLVTETPSFVFDWSTWDVIREILIADGAVIPENRQIPMLNAHSIGETANVLGSWRNIAVENNVVVGDAVFSSLNGDEKTKVEEGHITDVSAGYRTYDEFTVVIKSGASADVNGRTFVNDFNDGMDLFIRTKYDLVECSLVPIGADSAAKFRSENVDFELLQADLEKKIRSKIENDIKILSEKNKRSDKVEELKKMQNLAKQYQRKMPKDLNLSEKAIEYATNNRSSEDLKNLIMENMDSKPAPNEVEDPNSVDVENKELRNYSIGRALRNMAQGKREGLEFEMSKTIAEKLGRESRGIFLPTQIQKRANTAKNPAMIPASIGGFFETYLEKTVMEGLGVTKLPGLKGTVKLILELDTMDYEKVAEEVAAIQKKGESDFIELTPKQLSANTYFTRTMLNQSEYSVESWLRSQLGRKLQDKLNYVFVNGLGDIKGMDDFGIVNTNTNLSYAEILNVIGSVEDITDAENLKWLMRKSKHTSFRGVLKNSSAPNEGFIVSSTDNPDTLVGYGCGHTNKCDANKVFFGDFSKIVWGEWNTLELLLKEMTEAGNYPLVAFYDMDFGCLNKNVIKSHSISV